jgi:hypothetical protein
MYMDNGWIQRIHVYSSRPMGTKKNECFVSLWPNLIDNNAHIYCTIQATNPICGCASWARTVRSHQASPSIDCWLGSVNRVRDVTMRPTRPIRRFGHELQRASSRHYDSGRVGRACAAIASAPGRPSLHTYLHYISMENIFALLRTSGLLLIFYPPPPGNAYHFVFLSNLPPWTRLFVGAWACPCCACAAPLATARYTTLA